LGIVLGIAWGLYWGLYWGSLGIIWVFYYYYLEKCTHICDNYIAIPNR
jgi:hypothetical protein